MKTFLCLLILTLVASALAKTPQDRLRELSEECKPESGISEETLTKVRNHEEVDDPNLKKHGLCIMKKAGFMDDHGELLLETIKDKFNKLTENHEGVEKVIKKCAVKKDTPEDTATHFIKCVHEAKEKAH